MMKSPLLLAPIVVLFLASYTMHGAAASEDDSAQSVKEFMKQGADEYKRQHWDAARTAFLNAWNLKQHYAIAGGLAAVEIKLGQYRDAASHLKYARANLPPDYPEKLAEIETSLQECRSHLSTVRVTVPIAGASVSLDGQAVSPEVLNDELLLDPGPHTFRAEKPGYRGSVSSFIASAGETRAISLDLSRSLPVTPISASMPLRGPSPDRQGTVPDGSAPSPISARTWVLIGGGTATAVATGLGIFFSLRYASFKSDGERLHRQVIAESPVGGQGGECEPDAPKRPASCDELAHALDSRSAAAKNGNATWIAAGALGAATIATYLIWPHGEKRSPEKYGRVSITPWLIGARGGSFQLDF